MKRELKKQFIYDPMLHLWFVGEMYDVRKPINIKIFKQGILKFWFCKKSKLIFKNTSSKKRIFSKIKNFITWKYHDYYTDYGSFKIKNNYFLYLYNGKHNYFTLRCLTLNEICNIKRLFSRNSHCGSLIRPHNLRFCKSFL